jgi:phage major head subunit gpT-like protein
MSIREATGRRDIEGRFYLALEQDPGVDWVNDISWYNDKSDQEYEKYNWLGQAPVMRKWKGGRHRNTFSDQGVTIYNDSYEVTINLHEDELRRDKTGQLDLRIAETATRTNAHWAILLTDNIINGVTEVAYDDQYFFDTDHSEGASGTQSNKISIDISALPVNQHGDVANPSVEEMELAILRVVQQIMSFKDDQGQPMNELATSFRVMVPIPYWSAALGALNNPVLTSGKTNTIPNSGLQIKLTANARLPWTDKFVVFRTDSRVKPFIRQSERLIRTSSMWFGSDYHHKHKRLEIGFDNLRNTGYGFWQHACLATLE